MMSRRGRRTSGEGGEGLSEAPPSLAHSLSHSLAQVADDVFEDFVVFLGEAVQDVLHGLEALLPVVDL